MGKDRTRKNNEEHPIVRGNFKEVDAKIFLLSGRKDFKPGQQHTLSLVISQQRPVAGVDISYKHLPLVVRLLYRRYDKKFADFYCFDNKGVCLAHTYEIYERRGDGQFHQVEEEGKRDRSIEKLTKKRHHRDDLRKIVQSCYIPDEEFKNHPMIIGLKEGRLREMQSKPKPKL